MSQEQLRPLIQVGSEIRPMNDEEYEQYLWDEANPVLLPHQRVNTDAN